MTEYERLVRDHHGLVYRLALGVLRDGPAAEDVAQEVFLDILRRPAAWKDVRDPKAFLGRAAINRAIQAIRERSRRARREREAGERRAEMANSESPFRSEVRTQVAGLPAEERMVVELHFMEGFTLRETAATLEISERTVSTRVADALARLRRLLAAGAFAGMLAMLESELANCAAAPPAGLSERLRKLESGAGRSRAHRITRVAGVAVAVSVMVALVSWLAMRGGTGRGGEGPAISDLGGEADRDAAARAVVAGGPGAAEPGSGGTGDPRESAPGVAVRVQVVDAEGRPLPGREVDVWRDGGAGASGVLGRSKTDAAGLCEVEEIPPLTQISVEVSLGAGTVRDGARRVATPESGRIEVRIQLRVRRIRGHVADIRTGAPIPGAEVWMGLQGGGLEFVRESSRVLTDAEGRYGIETAMDENSWFKLFARAEGYATRPDNLMHFHSGADEEIVDLMLARGAAARGRIVDGSGTPIAGARLLCQRTPGCHEIPAHVAESEQDGGFVLEGLAAGQDHVVHVRGRGFAGVSIHFKSPEEGGDVADLGDLAVGAAGWVGGRVLTASGEPMPGIAVTLGGFPQILSRADKSISGEVSGSARTRDSGSTDASGRFRFEDLPPGTYVLMTAQPGLPAYRSELSLPPGGHQDGIEIRMPAGRFVTVHVLDDHGRPLPGIVVSCSRPWLEARTDVLGDARFLVSGSEAEFDLGRIEIVSVLDGRGPDQVPMFTPPAQRLPAGARELTFVFRRAGMTEGFALDPDGNPLAFAELDVFAGGRRLRTLLTDEAGRFQVLSTAGEAVDFILAGRVEGPANGFRLVDGEVRGVACGTERVRLQARWAATRTLRVRVRDGNGSAIAGARVHPVLPGENESGMRHYAVWTREYPFIRGLSRNSWKSAEGTGTLTDDEGLAVLHDLPDRDLAIHAVLADASWLPASLAGVRPAGQEVELRMRPGLVVSGQVVSGDGAPLEDPWVSAWAGQSKVAGVRCDKDGFFRFLVDPAIGTPLAVFGEDFRKGGRPVQACLENVEAPAGNLRIVVQELPGK
ncbi:MAG: sigma-70 family RNA polymerase sigma factor [Planctomycetes bacterium]|nr:sigma-70 family RNA polymerase sigma factor [Planctomycetota bacterium]